MNGSVPLDQLAEQVARALSFARQTQRGMMIATPLLYPGGNAVAVWLENGPGGYTVSDGGEAMKEADILGGLMHYSRVASAMAARFGIKAGNGMIHDMELPQEALVVAAMAVANAAKMTADQVAQKLSEKHTEDQREQLWRNLSVVFPAGAVDRNPRIAGASSELWTFDASVEFNGKKSIFDIVLPHAASVNAAIAKFGDLKDLGGGSPGRNAVIESEDRIPHLATLRRNATLVDASSGLEGLRSAA